MSSSNSARSRTRSQALQQRAERFFPGGVNSPVRAFRAVGGAPPFVERAQGAWLTDADGNYHSYPRHGDYPKVVIKDPLQPHLDMLPALKDDDIHNLMAYIQTFH